MKSSAWCSHCKKITSVEIRRQNGRAAYRCGYCSREWENLTTYKGRRGFSAKLQEIALVKVFPVVWPGYTVVQIDTLPSDLAKKMDIGGIDTMLFCPSDGHLVHVGQRYRQFDVWKNPRRRDFTIRENEWKRHISALQSGGVVPSFYLYGYVAMTGHDFVKLFIVHYRDWLVDVQGGKT